MGGRIDSHRHLVGIFTGNLSVHVEQIAVTLTDPLPAKAFDGVAKIQVNAEASWTDSATLVAYDFDISRSHVARNEISEAWIFPFQEIIAFLFRNLIGRTSIAFFPGNPNATVVTQRLAHQRQLRLIIAAHRHAGGMGLRETWISKSRAALVSAPDGRTIRTLGVGRKIEDVSVATCSQHNSISDVGFDFAGK